MSTKLTETHFYSESPETTQMFAANLAANMGPGQWLLLHGPMGAGKTHFVQGFMRGLGMQDSWRVDSPTFTIMNHYAVGPGVYHLDLFRLQDPDDLDCLNLEELLESPSLKCVEWPDPLAPWVHQMRGLFVQISPQTASGRGRDLRILPLELGHGP